MLEHINCDPERVHAVAGDPSVPAEEGACVVYWCMRAQRAAANHAFDAAVDVATALALPLVVVFKLGRGPQGNNTRHLRFMLPGILELAHGVSARGGEFALIPYGKDPIENWLQGRRPAVVITDEDAMPAARSTRTRVASILHDQTGCPTLSVDTDCVVPGLHFEKQEYAARTIRPKINRVLERFLRDEPHDRGMPQQLVFHEDGDTKASLPSVDQLLTDAVAFGIDDDVAPAQGMLTPGRAAGLRLLDEFAREKIVGYSERRNKPELDATSRLSAYLHYGNISSAECVLAVRTLAPDAYVGSEEDVSVDEDVDRFVEELVVRRELAANFVRFCPTPTTIACAPNWAQQTLAAHADDPRPYVYDFRELEAADTHDPLWNAAQTELVVRGHMHGYMRMYWAKKIFEWSPSAAEAFAAALDLNDRYSIDGRDPSGITGIAWSMCGVHDRPWFERPIFGTIRYMSLASTGRKFDSRQYIARWAGSSTKLF